MVDCTAAFDMVINNIDGRLEILKRFRDGVKKPGAIGISEEESWIIVSIDTLEDLKKSVIHYKKLCSE